MAASLAVVRRRIQLAVTLAALGAGVLVFLTEGGAATDGPAAMPPARVVFGHSAEGRQLVAVRLGDLASPHKALVVGVIHGDEQAGAPVIRALRRRYGHVNGVDLWTVLSVNPDGLARGTRRNAHGVDLNRNFSYRWSGAGGEASGYYAGPHPFSEPESRALSGLIARVRPDVTVYFHQPWGQVLAPCRGDSGLERRYSQISGVPLKRCRGQHLTGTATSWQEHRYRDSRAFVVELPAGRPSAAEIRRDARAAAVVSSEGAGAPGARERGPVGAGAPGGRGRGHADGAEATQRTGARPGPLAAIKPPIHDMLIPYPAKRKHEMAAYSKRHYGKREWRLRRVGLIVEHLSVTPSVSAVYNTFAPDYPDGEFGELPNTCAHYAIGRGGAIFRLVPTTIRCRHVVGLNHISVGIEHVGYTESDVLSRPRQLRASLRLTRWLQCRYHLRPSGVIGHNESLSSPFYRERDPRFRGQTHGDWRPKYMRRYRRLLRSPASCP